MIGRTLNHFRIEAELGAGGMGVVYRATDEKLRREVALKVLPESLAADPERRRRFLREARAAAAVTHNNIATVHEIGEADGHVFIAMELVPGETLRTHMAPGLSHAEAVRIAIEVAKGLARAHEKGVVHRDLKPENVMITPGGDVKILDFGLAKVLEVEAAPRPGSASTMSQVTGHGRVMGTPPYMSPEQASGEADIDARSDVFSFGAMLYEMLAGVAPFRGATTVAVLYAVIHVEPEPVETLRAELPPGIAAVVARCLKKARGERFASGGELLAALVGEPSTRPPDAPSARALPAGSAQTVDGMGTALGATVAAGPTGPGRVPQPARVAGRRSAWLWAVMGLVALLGAGLGTRSAWTKREPSAPLPSSSPSAAPHPTTLADLPLPQSAKPEALAEYVKGMQVLRDDTFSIALQHFKRATELDPSMALAHLRAATTGLQVDGAETVRAELAKATELRAQLGERDRALLDAVEPAAGRTDADRAELLARLDAAHARFPLDEEFLVLRAYYSLRDPVRGLAAARRAAELDPLDASAWEALGRSLAAAGDFAEGRRALERCAEISAESADCYGWLAVLDGATGRCEDMERDARRDFDREPAASCKLIVALVANERSDAVVRDFVAICNAHPTLEARAALSRSTNEALLALLAGRFDVALARLDDADRVLAASARADREVWPYGSVVRLRVQVLSELGRTEDARRSAREFADRASMLAQGAFGGIGPFLWLVRVSGASFDAPRRAWVEAQLRSTERPTSVWGPAWALPATNPAEAREALGALAADPRLALPRGGELLVSEGSEDGAAGHVFLLAGKPIEALPYLRREANNCFVFGSPFEHVHAQLDLGQALEQTADRPGACDAYAKVVARWGHAVPRSVTAEAARAGMKRLACAKAGEAR